MKVKPHIIRHIASIVRFTKVDRPLAELTTFKIGGPADCVCEPETSEQLINLVKYLRREMIPFLPIGGGSNVLFSDAGFRGVVIRMKRLNRSSFEQNGPDSCFVSALAGMPLPALVNKSKNADLTGLEDFWGIPGTIGGAVATNAGAGPLSIGDLLNRVDILTGFDSLESINRDQLSFGYRRMELPAGSIVLQAVLELRRTDPLIIREKYCLAKNKRFRTQPLRKASAGCIFKNPSSGISAGALIDQLGMKDCRIGAAVVSNIHANFIVNSGGATASDVLRLIEQVRTTVLERMGLELELEVQVVQ